MHSRYDDHAAAQNYVVDLLWHYGFDARKEVWISGEERIDVAGRCANSKLCKGYSIAVEISRTSDLAKDLDRLSKANYDLKFVVLLKPWGELPPINGILITLLEKFEHWLRYLLDIPLEYPLYSSERPELIAPPVGEKLDEFKKYIAEELGFPELVEESLRFILRTYALGEALVKIVRIPLYSQQEFIHAHEDLRVVNILSQVGVINVGGRGAYADGKVFLASLSAYGKELARSVARKVIPDNEAKIREEVRKHGVIIPFITSLMRCLEIAEEEPKYEAVLGGITYDVERICNSTLKSKIPPEAYLFVMNSYKLPKVTRKCVEFAGRFEELQLSFRGGVYGSKGQYYGDKICIVPELAEYIFNLVRDEALRKLGESGLMKEFNTILATYMIGSDAYRGVSLKPIDEILADFRVSREDVENLCQTLHNKGATSKLLDKPPYVVVVDMETFTREIIKTLRGVEDKIASL